MFHLSGYCQYYCGNMKKPLQLMGGESMTYESTALYKITKNGMKKLELRLVLIQDVIFGCSYQLRYVEID